MAPIFNMPMYEFYCDDCGVLDTVVRPMARSSDGLGCFECSSPMRRIYSAPALLNRKKPGSFVYNPKTMNGDDDRLAHLRDVEYNKGSRALEKVRSEIGEPLYQQVLRHKKENYA